MGVKSIDGEGAGYYNAGEVNFIYLREFKWTEENF